MKNILVATPTFILIAIVFASWFTDWFTSDLRVNLLGFSAVGLIGYSFIALFVYGLSFTFHGEPNKKFSEMSIGSKLLFSYLLTVLVLTLLISIYFMAHN
ncbi:LasU family protein [Secundilactobacillus yichangensis]|uniref:LasU family protein n=1 Tax=Secundilactobacillus yichangensis TaxID=2799580 RepID=UPI0035709E7F